jgi:hypothetical protein
MKIILIIDNDVAVNLFHELFENNQKHFQKLLSILSTQYNEIWIPGEVKIEFLRHPQLKRKRKKILEKIMEDYQFIRNCPINVSDNDIDLANNFSDEDRGETDAIIQAVKAQSVKSPTLNFSGISLLFKDKKAIKRAEQRNISILVYKDLASQMREVGLILPA